ncbi:hypothetical protein BsWGS_09076 [Bradybaena similaris]
MGFQDLYDIPDPYINLVLRSSPEGRKSTTVKEDDPNPVWNETFTFFINFTQANVLEISLMESNAYWFDQLVGTVYYDIVNIMDMDTPQTETFVFNDIAEVDIEFKLEFDRNPTLRYSLCLCNQEKRFIKKRKKRIFEAMRKLLGDEDGPQNFDEVPTIAVIGSGGGFRAMTGYSGVFKALVESGVLNCAMYACGLSGSSWLLSTLYSHPKWPDLDMGEFLDELKHSIDKSLLRFLNASTMYSYVKFLVEKRRAGQPVSFTDIFGRMVGETLLPDRMETTLTDQREKLKDAAVPLPLYTCVHVKKDVPARSFQEWVEFSPYEIGMPKYGTFMDAELFGSKFFMGKLVKQFEEQPLHYLQGIWGSAFCILFRRLLEENHPIEPTEKVREEMGDRLDEGTDESSSDCSEDDIDESSMDSVDSMDSESSSAQNVDDASKVQEDETTHVSVPWSIYQILRPRLNDTKVAEESQNDDSAVEIANSAVCSVDTSGNTDMGSIENGNITINDNVDTGSSCDADEEDDDVADENDKNCKQIMEEESNKTTEERKINKEQINAEAGKESKKVSLRQQSSNHSGCHDSNSLQGEGESSQSSPASQSSPCELSEDNPSTANGCDPSSDCKKRVKWGTCPSVEAQQRREAYISSTSVRKSKSGSKSYWKQCLKGILESNSWELLSTRRGRAAVIHNFMRGLSLQQSYPLSPFTPVDERVEPGDEFDGIFEMHPTSVKLICMVDAGLAFNSPYPLILRPQRAVDIILSFDFSARPSDNDPPFKELLLAEKWAKLNRLPFPPIDTSVFDKDDIKELYIFRHPTDVNCPVIFHFVLVNQKFRYYKKPEVPRETKEEFEFAEFDLFTDPRAPYSTFNFTYTHRDFERLSQLTEFNTLLHISDIKEVIKEIVLKKRETPTRQPEQPSNSKWLRNNTMKEHQKLQHFISRMESRNSTHTGSHPSTPFYTPTSKGDLRTNPFFAQHENKALQNPSNDNSIFNSQRDMRKECFCKNICRQKNLHPASLYKSGRHNGNSTTKKEAVRNSTLPPNSPHVSSVYSRLPNSAEHVLQHQQTSSESDSEVGISEQKCVPASVNTAQGLELKNSSADILADTIQTTTDNHKKLLCPETTSESDVDQDTTRRPLLSPTLKFPGTMEFTPSETTDQICTSLGYGSLSDKTGISCDRTSSSEVNMDSLGENLPEIDTCSIEKTGSANISSGNTNGKFKTRGKVKKHQTPNPFFAKAFFMRSPHNSASSSKSSCGTGDETGATTLDETDNQTDSTVQQSTDLVQTTAVPKLAGRLSSRTCRPSSLIITSNNTEFSSEAHSSSSESSPEVFTLAPETFIWKDLVETDNQTDNTVQQSTDLVQTTAVPKLAGRLSSRTCRPSPLIISSNNTEFSSEAPSSSSGSSSEIFTLAPEAFKADGTPVFDSQEAKMYYESAKKKRKLFRRQSTVNSLNSISLD